MCIVPCTCPAGIPSAVPGLNPTSPLINVSPVLVIVAAAITAKLPAAPRLIVAGPVPTTPLVVKLHGFGAAPVANELPDRSVTILEIVAVYCVLAARLVAAVPVYVTTPVTGVAPGPVKVNVATPIVAGFIASLNVAETRVLTGTTVAPFAGTVEISFGAPVVKLHTKQPPRIAACVVRPGG